MKIFIVEDEEHSKKTLINFLTKYVKEVEIVGSAGLVSEAIDEINKLKPELVFLDIDLPDGNGFEVLNGITNPSPKVIFVTAYNQYAVKAFQVSAIDYLLKPVDPMLLKTAVQKAIDSELSTEDFKTRKEILQTNRTGGLQKLALPTQQGIQMVKINDIIRIEADGNYAKIYLVNAESVFVSKQLKVFENWLEGLSFFRVHHSHIINLNYLQKYIKGDGGSVIMDNGHEVEVSRRRKDEFLKMISR
jgi:two-component system LytT family response regulator